MNLWTRRICERPILDGNEQDKIYSSFFKKGVTPSVKFVLKTDELLAGMTLKEAEEVLPSSNFLRTHRSFIVSVNAITAMFGNTIEIGKIQIPIGGNYKGAVLERVR